MTIPKSMNTPHRPLKHGRLLSITYSTHNRHKGAHSKTYSRLSVRLQKKTKSLVLNEKCHINAIIVRIAAVKKIPISQI